MAPSLVDKDYKSTIYTIKHNFKHTCHYFITSMEKIYMRPNIDKLIISINGWLQRPSVTGGDAETKPLSDNKTRAPAALPTVFQFSLASHSLFVLKRLFLKV